MGTKDNPGRFDCYASAASDEPMFVLLARDRHAPSLVREWADRREAEDEDPAKVAEARDCAAAMETWRTKSEELRLKTRVLLDMPDDPPGPGPGPQATTSRTYVVEHYTVAHEKGWPGAEEARSSWQNGGWGLWEFVDGKPARLLGQDGGEPEDQLLVRDWRWVKDAVEAAYADGRRDAVVGRL